MTNKKKIIYLLLAVFIASLFFACNNKKENKQNNGKEKFTHSELVNIVNRSFQYVAMYNVINNFAMQENNPIGTKGWNKTFTNTKLADHTVKAIARPNNDTYYIISILDLRDDGIVINYPAFDSKYVSIETSAYDHYVNIPLATSKGDFKKPVNVLYYSDHTKNYRGEPVEGIDTVINMSGDFVITFLRLMPHLNDPARNQKIKRQVSELKIKTLSEFQGKPAVEKTTVNFPEWKNDQFVFKNNFEEVMQFVFNHISFDENDKMDKAALETFAKLGIVPGKEYDPKTVVKLDGETIAAIADSIAKASLAIWNNPDGNPYLKQVFLPKGRMTLEAMVVQSAVGPIGLPATQAVYPGIGTEDGKPLNAMHDYVIKMPAAADLPPAKTFWSVTLYDAENGYFIPNDRHKYVVGENSGRKLNKDGGIEIYIAAEKPDGAPEENWLPINRKDENLDLIMRIYVPDWEKMKDWKQPKAEMIK